MATAFGAGVTIDEAAAIVDLGAATAEGRDDRLRTVFEAAVDVVPPAHVEEYLLQTYLFAGFPRAINAFFAWQGWAAARGIPREVTGVEAAHNAALRERGERLCRIVYGENYEALQRRLERLHPALADWTLVEGYGKVLSRPGPDPARRELAAIGSLIAMDAERQLAAHLRGALRAGVPQDILREAVRPAAARCGRITVVNRLLAGAA